MSDLQEAVNRWVTPMTIEELQATLDRVDISRYGIIDYDENSRLLLPSEKRTWLLQAARLVANPNLQQWIDEVVLALDAATKIGQRSCNSGDHLHYANHDRLIASAPNFAALDPPGDTG